MTALAAGSDGVLEVAAPSRADAEALVQRLARCQCVVVQHGADAWAVRATTWSRDRRALQEALSAVEAWLAATGRAETKVGLGDRTFTLAAEAGR